MNGVGEPVGPDLTQLDSKMTKVEVLRSLLEPSAKIDEKYLTHVFVTKTGKNRHGDDPGRDPRANQGD